MAKPRRRRIYYRGKLDPKWNWSRIVHTLGKDAGKEFVYPCCRKSNPCEECKNG